MTGMSKVASIAVDSPLTAAMPMTAFEVIPRPDPSTIKSKISRARGSPILRAGCRRGQLAQVLEERRLLDSVCAQPRGADSSIRLRIRAWVPLRRSVTIE